MNQTCQEAAAPYYFETAQLLLGEVVAHERAHQDTMLGALVLSTYMPLLHQRAEEAPVTREDCEQIYASLGEALHYLRPLQTDQPPQWRMVEVAMLALSARARHPELLLYPASPREEQSAHQPLNHDSYFYTGGDKVPVQQKLLPTQKTYDDCITILTVEPILQKALRVTGQQQEATLADQVNYLLSLIIAEAGGYGVNRDEVKVLNFLTEAVAAHRTKGERSDA